MEENIKEETCMKNFNFKANKPLGILILVSSICFLSSQFVFITDPMKCFLTGMGVTGYCIGMYAMSHDISKIRSWKKQLFKNILRLEK